MLDVTFDGIRIMDGDLVSANPLIQISLSDENPLLPLNDTADFELYLRRPGASQPVLIPMGDPAVTFFPATAQDNEARLEFRPDLEQTDGMYELLVRARVGFKASLCLFYGQGDKVYEHQKQPSFGSAIFGTAYGGTGFG
jgi:hypothetical protein